MASLLVRTLLNFLSIDTQPPNNDKLRIAGTMRRTINFPQHLTTQGLRAQWGSDAGESFTAQAPFTDYRLAVLFRSTVFGAWENLNEFCDLIVFAGFVDSLSIVQVQGSSDGATVTAVDFPCQTGQWTPQVQQFFFCGQLAARVQYVRFIGNNSVNLTANLAAYVKTER